MAEIKKDEGGQQWGSRWGFVIASLGMAIGTGNIWRFPRVLAANGGAAFFITLFLALFLWAIPLICMEGVLGKVTRMGCIGSFKELIGRKFAWMGFFFFMSPFLVACYYGVVLGWCIRYLVYAVTGVLQPGTDTKVLWDTFLHNADQGTFFYFIAVALCVAVLSFGVQNGIEKGNKVFIPSIFVLLFFLAVKACSLPGAERGLEFMFKLNIADFFNAKIYLEALTQAAWSTGAGWGLFLTYFIYTKKDEDILLNSCTACFADTSAALLAGMAVIPTIYALSPDPAAILSSGSNGLAFIGLTQLFVQVPGGTLMAIAFFLALSLAALSSEIAMIEMGTRVLQDLGMSRKKSFAIIVLIVLGVGTLAARDNVIFENMDFTWGVGLILCGLLASIGAMIIGVDKIWDEYICPVSDLKVKWLWSGIRFFPVWFVLVFGYWVYQAFTWYPGEWYKFYPMDKYTYTPGSMFVQWGIVLVIGLVLNNWLADNSTHKFDAKL